MKSFQVTIRRAGSVTQYAAIAETSSLAWEAAAMHADDEPCAITVIPCEAAK